MAEMTFMGANLVAQTRDWAISDWEEGEVSSNSYYQPIETFQERLRTTVRRVAEAGFDAFDIWTGQLNWRWATNEHLEAARRVFDELGVIVPTYAGAFGDTVDEFRAACRVASAVGASVLAGSAGALTADRDGVIAALRHSGLKLGIENHPGEKVPADILRQIGDDAVDVIGTAVDTGWWGTNGYDAADAIRELGPHVFSIHLKDVRSAGAHETCVLGEGVVPIRDVLRATVEVGYSAPFAIEHEPYDYDPLPEVVESARLARSWLAG